MKKLLLLLVLLIIVLLTFWKYGRSLYKPAIQKIKGKETVASIKNKLSPKVIKR